MTTTPSSPRSPCSSDATVIRFDTVSALSDARALEAALGPIAEVRLEPVSTNGSTEAVHFRVTARLQSHQTLRLWLKVNRISSDWTARGSGDAVGREPAMLAEPKLDSIWDAFTCPYRAFAIEGGVYGLLMDDLRNELFRGDVAFSTADEDALLGAMAALHARYWNSDALRLPWLQTAWRRMFFLGPHDQTAPERRVRYWPDPLPLLPRSVAELLTLPTDALVERCFGLPWTLFTVT